MTGLPLATDGKHLPRSITGETSGHKFSRSNSLGLTRTQSDHAQLSLARMASLETAHLTNQPEDDSGHDDIWLDNKYRRSSDNDDLESRVNELQQTHPPQGTVGESDEGAGTAVQGDIGVETDGPAKSSGESAEPVDQKSHTSLVDGRGTDSAAQTETTVLQDQTNLLPGRQIVLVFLGLSCALFVSLLDQTMCVP